MKEHPKSHLFSKLFLHTFYSLVTQNVVLKTSSSALPENLLEMQNLGLHLRAAESESVVITIPRRITCTMKFEKNCFIELGKLAML